MNKRVFDTIGETLYTTTLPNGLTIHALPKSGYMRSFAAFSTNYGGAMRRFSVGGKKLDTPAGVAHFLEHKMFDMPDGTNALSLLSASGASPNAWTSGSMTAYHFESTTDFEANLRTLLRFVSTPYFTPESVQKEQGIIGQEIRMTEDNPFYSGYYNFLKCLLAHNPYRDTVAGTIESIAEITDRTLYDCYSTFYAPSNMVLCVAGGEIDPDAVARIAGEILPKEKAPVPVPDFGPDEGLLPVNPRMEAKMEVSAPQFLIGAKFAPAPDGDEKLRQYLTGELALRCLTGRSSRFFTELYSAGLLTGNVSAEAEHAAGLGIISIGGESREPERVLEMLNSEVARIASDGLGSAEFSRAGRATYGAQLRSAESFSSLCFSLAAGHFDGFCPLDAFELLPGITADECARFITENLAPERLAVSLISPKG